MKPPIEGLYLITDESSDLLRRVGEALTGGVSVLQFRSKSGDQLERLRHARELKQLCDRYRIPLIINDDIHLARTVDADGVHLGQDDGSVTHARQILGDGKIVGVSTHSLEEARRAEGEGADYIGLGAMFPTGTKRVDHLIGPDALSQIRPHISIPIVAIGGITRDDTPTLIDRGADAVAVISAVMGAPSPAIAAREISLLFNRRSPLPRGRVLTVAGSDSGGGAGIQADLKTITLLGWYGASVITALTAQNTTGVTGIHHVPPRFIADQMYAVLSDIPIDVVKTGMLDTAAVVSVVAERLRHHRQLVTVVDPVMIAKGGAPLIDDHAIATLVEQLLPLTYLLTPNIPEAERLTGMTITDEEGMERAAHRLRDMGVHAVLLKGGHLPDTRSVDILHEGSGVHRYESPRILTRNTHGTGCTLSAAIATLLAQGSPLPEAVATAKGYITDAIRSARPLGGGHGPVDHFTAAQRLMNDEKENDE